MSLCCWPTTRARSGRGARSGMFGALSFFMLFLLGTAGSRT